MESSVIETQYQISFHKEEATVLGQHLKSRQNVVLIGMRRVGISNFLRFFLYHKDIKATYIGDGKNHLFIPIDLNGLVEREIYPFWTLTLKRIADAVNASSLPTKVKKSIETLFLDSIQTQDLFFTIDSVRKSLLVISQNNVMPTLFFILFDRMKDAVTQEFFANLQGVRDATNQIASYVFTSFRPLDNLAPKVFTKTALITFAQNMYIPPVRQQDIEIIFETQRQRYGVEISPSFKSDLLDIIDGYVRYLNLSLTILNEKRDHLNDGKDSLLQMLVKDERIILQSEELWESLTADEQDVLKKIQKGTGVSDEEQERSKYLWKTGFLTRSEIGEDNFFSPLFVHYLREREGKDAQEAQPVEFTKKEHLLFDLLKNNLSEICDREKIAGSVWPEVEEFGVSDWAIDRLVARVRNKLKAKKSNFEIQTIKTRGYKLISK